MSGECTANGRAGVGGGLNTPQLDHSPAPRAHTLERVRTNLGFTLNIQRPCLTTGRVMSGATASGARQSNLMVHVASRVRVSQGVSVTCPQARQATDQRARQGRSAGVWGVHSARAGRVRLRGQPPGSKARLPNRRGGYDGGRLRRPVDCAGRRGHAQRHGHQADARHARGDAQRDGRG